MEESENRLFEKVPSQQETELEQREDDLRQREARLRQRKAAQDPAAAKAKRPFDEFNEASRKKQKVGLAAPPATTPAAVQRSDSGVPLPGSSAP